MKSLKITYDYETDFCELEHPYSKRFVTYISQGIKPLTRRKFDPESKRWSVHTTRIPQVILAGKRWFDHVDYGSLPEDVQIQVVQYIEQHRRNPIEFPHMKRSPRAVLFVTEDAPQEVIKAAYRALAQKYHPDHGGDPARFREIDEAYKELKQ